MALVYSPQLLDTLMDLKPRVVSIDGIDYLMDYEHGIIRCAASSDEPNVITCSATFDYEKFGLDHAIS